MPEPEGGPGRWRPLWFAVLGAGLLTVLAAATWSGTTRAIQVLTGLLVVVGLARALLPAGRVGPLVVRSRALDVSCCLLLAVLLLVVIRLVPTSA